MTNVSGGVPTLRLMTRYRGARAVWPQLQDTIYSITYTQTFLLVFVFAFVFAICIRICIGIDLGDDDGIKPTQHELIRW